MARSLKPRHRLVAIAVSDNKASVSAAGARAVVASCIDARRIVVGSAISATSRSPLATQSGLPERLENSVGAEAQFEGQHQRTVYHSNRALDRLIAFGCAAILGLDAAAIDDDAARDRDAVGLRAERLAVGRRQLQGPDAGGPALSAEVAARRRYLNLPGIGRSREHRIELFANHLLDVRWRLGRRRFALLGPHELRDRRTAVRPSARRER